MTHEIYRRTNDEIYHRLATFSAAEEL